MHARLAIVTLLLAGCLDVPGFEGAEGATDGPSPAIEGEGQDGGAEVQAGENAEGGPADEGGEGSEVGGDAEQGGAEEAGQEGAGDGEGEGDGEGAKRIHGRHRRG